MNPESEVRRAEEARQLLENPLLQEAFATIRAETLAAWEAAPARDVEGREQLWITLKLLGRVEAHITSVVESGKMARATLAQRAREVFQR